MKRPLLLITLLFICFACPPQETFAKNVNPLLESLDRYIKESRTYTETKEEEIRRIKERIDKASGEEALFEVYSELFDEYRSYKYDSAYVYASKSLAIGKRLDDIDKIVQAQCDIAFCLVSSGLFKEAYDTMSGLDISQASDLSKKEFYSLYSRLHYDLADYNHANPFHEDYRRKGSEYTDSLLRYIPEKSQEWWYATAQKQMKDFRYAEAAESFNTMLEAGISDTHTEAIVLSCLGCMSFFQGRRDEALEYLIRSAIDDIISATKETTALRQVANLVYENGDITRSNIYVRQALADADFYNARHRKIEVGQILPIIEQERFNLVSRQRNVLIFFGTVLSLLLIAILSAIFIIYRQNRKLHTARKELEHMNRKLSEANQIKDEYIGSSFYTNSEYLDKMEDIYNTINQRIVARQWDILRSEFKLSRLNAERENMYASFDETFLKLFPNFIEQYNNLFPVEEQVCPKSEKSLTPEMRIFALIRLGITKPERIARFLNFSVHTVNTYKTRVKNKSLVANEDFEKRIMKIR